MKPNQPIGVFDSGIGGLTVANAIQKWLPQEQIIYFGDTAHLPYGDKSAVAIRGYSMKIADYLLGKKCKTIVIACNTASSVAYNTIYKHYHQRAQIVNVIDPVVNYVAGKYNNAKVGVIGTKGTINSRIYVRRIKKKNATLDVPSLATPLLAPMIEEGFFNNYISRTIINNYLDRKAFKGMKALILGCTHYPLIKPEVEAYFKGKTEIVDSAEVVAKYVLQKLQRAKLVASRNGNPHHQFHVSDFTESFEQSTKTFFGEEIHLKKVKIWE